MSAIDIRPISGEASILRRVARRLLRRSSDVEPVQVALIRRSGSFDARWYLERYPDVAASGLDPVQHYVLYGASEGRDPRADFSTAFYLRNNPDVAASGINPFVHFIKYGRQEGRACLPSNGGNAGAPRSPGRAGASTVEVKADSDRRAKADADVIERSGTFDKAYYLATYPGMVPQGMDPIRHYVKYGAANGLNPNALFNTQYYLAKNADVAASGMNPLVHFCRYGFRELRNPSPGFDIAWYWVMYLPEDLDTNPLAHYLAHGLLDGSEIRTAGRLSHEDKERMADACQRLMEEVGSNNGQALYLRLSAVLTRLSRWAQAETAFRMVLETDWKNAMAHGRLAAVLARQGKWWQAVESWEAAIALDASRAKWFFHLGEAQEEMNRFALAADAYQQAIDLEPDHSKWYYRLGYMREKTGQRELADEAYAEAVSRDPRADVKAFGIGVLHQSRGYWPEAAEAYAKELEKKPASAELHYRLGVAHDHCYRWQDAEHAYRNAIALKPDTPGWHYRYGLVLERQQRYVEAAEAYAAGALLSSETRPSWWYRRGYALAAAGRFEEACLAYIRICSGQPVSSVPRLPEAAVQSASVSALGALSLNADAGGKDPSQAWLGSYMRQFSTGADLIARAVDQDWTDAAMHFRLGLAREFSEDWPGAAHAYANAVARSNEHCPEWYYRLGFALFRAGRFEDACDAFRQYRIVQRAHGLSEKKFVEDENIRSTTSYVEYSNTLGLDDHTILYECNGGRNMAGNPLALFKALLADPVYAGYLHVWVLNERERIPDEYRRMRNVIFVVKRTDLYLRYLCTAKYLITGHGFPNYFVRKPGQKYLNTWHGTPLKTLGKEQKYKFYDHKWAQRTFLQATHLISPNPHTTGVLFDSYDIRHLFAGRLAETGYPRIDAMLNASPEHRAMIRKRLGVDSRSPVVLYAPTWRGTPGDVSFDVERLKGDLQRLGERDCQLIFRGHPWMESVVEGESLPCTVVPVDIDTNELLSVVDVLITDYSSIFFDFIVTGKPVLYYIHDQAEYEQARGLYFSMDEMPGYKCVDIDVLCESLDKALGGSVPDPDGYRSSQQAFSLHDDGNATRRVIDFFFNDVQEHVVDPGPRKQATILFHGGSFAPNGITTSFLNLVKHIDRDRYQVVLGFSPNVVEEDAAKRQQFQKLPKNIAVIPRAGGLALSWEERWVYSQYGAGHRDPTEEEIGILRNLFGREFRRMYGAARFDVAVTFSGYDSFWGSIFNFNNETFRKAIYLHNDMSGESLARFPDLVRMFKLYRSADVLVSVSGKTNELNRSNLSAKYGIAPEKFISCDNVQDPEGIIALSKKDLASPADEALFEQGPVFINVARLSVEKGHAKLVRSFERLVVRHPTAKLLILGAGPQHHHLAQLIAELQLEGHVFLLGYRPNPYPFLAKADCFVLSSDHEGQPMTLLEALILGKPIVATDITGNRSVLEGRPGMLVENSEEGLIEGMNAFLRGELDSAGFNWHQYQANAIGQFQERVVGLPGGVPPPESVNHACTSSFSRA